MAKIIMARSLESRYTSDLSKLSADPHREALSFIIVSYLPDSRAEGALSAVPSTSQHGDQPSGAVSENWQRNPHPLC